MKYDIFISYRRIDSDFPAERIYNYFRNKGYRVFIDNNIKSGRFSKQLEDNIKNCKDFLIIISQHSLDECKNNEDWVRREILCALEREGEINIIPIMMQGFNKHNQLSKDISGILEYQGVESVTVKNCSQKCKEIEKKLKSKPIIKNIRLGIFLAVLIFLIAIMVKIAIPIKKQISNTEYESNNSTIETISVDYNHSSNIVNGGIACYDGSRYFFSDDCLWSESNSGEHINKIYDKTVYYLNSIEEYLYFVVPSENNAICRIKKDGTEFEKIYDNYCYELTYYNGWLYFSSNRGETEYQICRMKTDGSDLCVLADCYAWYMSIYNDMIFFCNYDDGKSIYSMNIDGSDYKLLRSGECCDLCVVNNKIYFSTDMKLRSLHSIDINGDNEEKLLDSYTRFTNYYEGKLFFINSDGILCSSDLNGDSLSVLYSTTSYAFITLLPNRFYCCDAKNNNQLIVLNT